MQERTWHKVERDERVILDELSRIGLALGPDAATVVDPKREVGVMRVDSGPFKGRYYIRLADGSRGRRLRKPEQVEKVQRMLKAQEAREA